MKKILTYILIFVVVFGAVFPALDFVGVTGGSSVVYAGETIAKSNGVECDFFYGEGTWAGCLAIFSETILYEGSSFVLTMSGQLFNSLLSFSLSHKVMNADFVTDTWGSLRDMANLLFIFILVAVSIGIILGFSNYNNKGIIRDVIIVALLINFSLFTARVVIDTGNIMGLAFYDAIQAPETSTVVDVSITGVPEKDISGNFMSTFNPARLVDNSSFEAWLEEGGKAMSLFFVFLVASVINIYTAYIFFMAGFIFVVRIAWLWILMIVSPLAFISYAIPTFKSNWDKWWSKLFDKAFCLLVFMFLMWLTLTIIGSNFFNEFFVTDIGGLNFLEFLTLIFLQFMISITLLRLTLSETKKMCDDGGLGVKAFSLVKGAAGLAVGAATGGAAFAARGVVGAKVGQLASTMEKGKFATTGSGKLALKTLRNIENAKWGTKEGYKDRVKRQATEHATYAKSLTGEKKDDAGKITQENRQKQYLDNMREASPLRILTQSRAGAQKYAKDTDKKVENEAKRDEKQKELERIKDDISRKKDFIKNSAAEVPDRRDLDRLVNEREKIERELKDLKEKINPPKEKKDTKPKEKKNKK